MIQRNHWMQGWKRKQWAKKVVDCSFGEQNLTYAASDKFTERGLEPGDILYVASVEGGILYLGGRIEVSVVVDRYTAAQILGKDVGTLWPAAEYALGNLNKPDYFRPRQVVPQAVIDNLWFKHHKLGKSRLKPAPNGGVNSQTLRVMRLLLVGQEKSLEQLLSL